MFKFILEIPLFWQSQSRRIQLTHETSRGPGPEGYLQLMGMAAYLGGVQEKDRQYRSMIFYDLEGS